MIVASRRAPGFSGSSRQPSGGGDAHSFMTFGLCTRNEKCAPAPLTNQALPLATLLRDKARAPWRIRVAEVGAGAGIGRGGWNWAEVSSTAFSLLRHSLNVLKITVANPPPEATPRLPEPRTKLRLRTSIHQSSTRRTTQFQQRNASHDRRLPQSPRHQWVKPTAIRWRGRALFHDVRAMHEE
jgi:hypothetical protein